MERTRSKAEQVLLEVYAELYGIEADEMTEVGNAIRVIEGLSGEQNLYITRPLEKTLITVSPELSDYLGDHFLQRCTAEELGKRFTGWELEERHPHLIYEEESGPDFTHPDGFEIRKIDPGDHQTIQAFLDRNSKSDVEDALIDVDDPDEEIRMAYYGNIPVGYAGYRVWEKGLSDTGILIHPDSRGRGLGSSLVGEVTAACLANGRTPLWRTWDGNPGSLRVAMNNGYTLKWRTDVYRWSTLLND